MTQIVRSAMALALALLATGCMGGEDVQPPGLVGDVQTLPAPVDGNRSLAAESSPPASGYQRPAAAAAPAFDATIPQGDGGPAPVGVLAAPTTAALSPAPTQATATLSARVQFVPIMGAAAKELGPLNQRILQRSSERGITITGDGSANYLVRGYFSTLREAGGNTLIYVWDVFDRSGTRVHRIQGKEMAVGQGVDAALRTIADRTVEDLAAWLGSRAG